jgi:nucleoside-diphosphate-sugar epimerase
MEKSTNRRISILGCGWLGLPLGKRLISEGFRVKGSTTRAERLPLLKEAGMDAYRIQLQAGAPAPAAEDFWDTDVLIITIPPGRREQDVCVSYRKIIEQVVEQIRKYQIPHFLYTSTTGVYPDADSEVNEMTHPDPKRSSARAVSIGEQLLVNQEINGTILRLAGLVGPDRHPGKFLAGQTEVRNGLVPVNLVHQEDVVEIVLQVIQQECWGTVLNVCADQHPLKADYYRRQIEMLGLEPPTFIEERSGYKIVSNQKVKQLLGYRFRHPDPMEFQL